MVFGVLSFLGFKDLREECFVLSFHPLADIEKGLYAFLLKGQ